MTSGLNLDDDAPALSMDEDVPLAAFGLDLDLDEEPAGLTLVLGDEEDFVPEIIQFKLRGGCEQSLVSAEEMLGKEYAGFKVIEIDDVYPPGFTEDWYREVTMRQVQP